MRAVSAACMLRICLSAKLLETPSQRVWRSRSRSANEYVSGSDFNSHFIGTIANRQSRVKGQKQPAYFRLLTIDCISLATGPGLQDVACRREESFGRAHVAA